MTIELYLSMYFDEICTDYHVTLCLKCLGFFFSYWMFFFLIICIEKLAKYRFCYKAWLIHQVSDHIYILENCVSVVSMIGYFPYISILSFKEIEYLP